MTGMVTHDHRLSTSGMNESVVRKVKLGNGMPYKLVLLIPSV